MLKKIVFIICLSFCFSCSDKTSKDNDDKNIPQVLQNETNFALTSLSKRYKENILDELYNEALENDVTIKNLDEKINLANGVKIDSLKSYNEYLYNNKRYWLAVNHNLKQIKDSILRKEMERDFKNLEKEYDKVISDFCVKDSVIAEKENLLYDYYTILKLRVTSKMIKKYQANKLPKQDNHLFITTKYDSLIKATKNEINRNK